MTPAPSWPHQIIVGNLHRLIANHVHAQRLGVIFVAPLDVVFTEHDVVEPDVLFFTPGGSRHTSAPGMPKAHPTWPSRCCRHQRDVATR